MSLTLLWILGATFINSLISLVGIFSLWLKEKLLQKIVFLLIALSAGALLSGALFHLTAESLEKLEPETVFALLIGGFCLFFLAERFLWWRHCHEEECEIHPVTYLVLIGDGIHNFIDGVVIAASFLVSLHFGTVITLLILAHEIPQELGDFGVLVYGGFSKEKALFFNFLSQLTCVLGGVLSYFVSLFFEFSYFILPLAAGGFIYIAASDLIPELHKEIDRKRSFASFSIFILGIAIVVLLKVVAE